METRSECDNVQVERSEESCGSVVPTVSIVVPTYNNAEFLPELIDSVINQYLTSWQLVIIDDGSTDNTEEVVEPYTSAHSNIEYHRISNGGPGHARNVGAGYATGDWLLFADADDMITKRSLRDLVALGEREACDIVTGDVRRLVDGQRKNSALHRIAFNSAREGRTTIYESPSLLYDTSVGNTIYRRSFYEQVPITWVESHFYEDIATIMPSFFEARSVGVLKEVVYLWRVRNKGSQSTTQQYATIKNFNDRMATIHDVDHYFETNVTDIDMTLNKDYKWLSHDLRLYLNVFPEADDEYRAAVMDAVTKYASHVDGRVFARLRAIDRIKYVLAARQDAEGIARAVSYDRDHFPNLHVVARDGRMYGEFPFDGLSDADTDMTDELHDRGTCTKVKRAEFGEDSLKLTTLVQITNLEQHQAQVTGRFVDHNGSTVAQGVGTSKPLSATSADAKRFDWQGSAFNVKFEFNGLSKLVASLSEGVYKMELDASFDDISCAPATLGNPIKGSYPRPYPILIGDKVVIVDYDVDWRLTLKVEKADRLVTTIRLADNRCFVFERTDGSDVRFEIPLIGEGDQRTFEFEDAQLLDSRPIYFARRTALNPDGVRQGFMLADPHDGNMGYELWRVYSNTKGHACAQMIRPGAVVTSVGFEQTVATLEFTFPLPFQIKTATLLLCSNNRDSRIPLRDEGLTGEGHAFSTKLNCSGRLLRSLPSGTYAAKVEFELDGSSLTGWAWSGEARDRAVRYIKTAGRTFSFDRRDSSLYITIWGAPAKA